jgi:hypothetical protein
MRHTGQMQCWSSSDLCKKERAPDIGSTDWHATLTRIKAHERANMRPVVFFTLCLTAMLVIPFSGKARAETGTALVYTSISPQELLSLLEGEKGTVALDENEGDTTIEGRVNGTDYQIYFYECDGREFADLAQPTSQCLGFEYRAYYTGFQDDTETINNWNGNNHYGTLWRDEDGDLALQFNTVVEGGITEANIRTGFQWWLAIIQSFDEFMGTP